MKFIHFNNWDPGNKLTWIPIDHNGDVIPHVYGHVTTEDIKSALLLPDWLDCDLYEVVETVQKAFDWLGNGLIATPIGFRPWSGKVTAWYQENLYCDLGCLDCEYAYHHIDLETRPISGVFAVRRGAKVFDLVKESAGESFFPNEFKLINAL